jgi:hypothetical protein
MSSESTVGQGVVEFVGRMMERVPARIESILHYLHPFTGGGVVIVFGDDAGFLPDLIAEVYRCAPPPGLSLHCLRLCELPELSLPGLFQLPDSVNEQTSLPYYLKHKGTLLVGRDVRDEISLPRDARAVLDHHLEACTVYLRAHGVLRRLAKKQYQLLFEQLDRHLRALMATALLIEQQWEVEPETLPERFSLAFKDEKLDGIWEEFTRLRQQLPTDDESACRRAAFEAAWLFESFVEHLSRYTVLELSERRQAEA